MTKKPRTRTAPPISRTTIELAAIAICGRVYSGKCACDGSPHPVCNNMRLAAVAAAAVIVPDDAARLAKEST